MSTMQWRPLLLGFALPCFFAPPLCCEELRTAVIIVENKSPEVQVAIYLEKGLPERPKLFLQSAPNQFEYKFLISNDAWFQDATIKITWKNAFERADGKKIDLDQRIVFQLRRDFPPEVYIPIFFSNDDSEVEMGRLEDQTDANDLYERFFRGEQIATFYRRTIGAKHGLAQRAATIFVLAALELVERGKHLVKMSEAVERISSESFGDKYAERIRLARTYFWEDLNYIDDYIRRNDCETARMLLAIFQELHAKDPKAFQARHGQNSKALEERAGKVSSECRRT